MIFTHETALKHQYFAGRVRESRFNHTLYSFMPRHRKSRLHYAVVISGCAQGADVRMT